MTASGLLCTSKSRARSLPKPNPDLLPFGYLKILYQVADGEMSGGEPSILESGFSFDSGPDLVSFRLARLR